MADGVKRDDKYEFAMPGCAPVLVKVTRVARDGSWADLWCTDGHRTWGKRQPLPLPEGLTPREWTTADALALHRAANPPVIEVPVPDMTVTEVAPNSYRVVIGDPWGEPDAG